MKRTLTVRCDGDRSAALRCADQLIQGLGFVRDGAPDAGTRRYAHPRPWHLADQHPMRLTREVEVRARDGVLDLTYDEEGALQRTLALSGAVAFLALLLILANFLWASPMQPLSRVLLPVAPWPVLTPLLHRNMKLQAHRRWYGLLRTVARLSGSAAPAAAPVAEPRETQPV